MDLTTIIINYNTSHLLHKCINSLRNAALNISMNIVIVDNASSDDSVSVLQQDFADCDLIVNNSNIGFGRANNQCIPFIKGMYVLLLNTDAFVSVDTINKTIRYMDDNQSCGVLGVRLLGREGDLQPSCRFFPTPLNIFLQRTGFKKFFPKTQLIDDMTWDHNTARECDWVPGCYYLIRQEVVEKVGLFDPRYFLYYEEVDHCFAAKKAGWEVHYFPDTSVVHIGGESAKSDSDLTSSGKQVEVLQIESELLFFCKNHGGLAVFGHVLLLTLADMIFFCKNVMKGRFNSSFTDPIKHGFVVWSLYFKTHFANTSTR